MTYIGIDPGSSSGYIAVIGDEEYDQLRFSESTLRDIYLFLDAWFVGSNYQCTAVLEVVHGMPGMSVKAVSAFMKNVGHIEMALSATQVPFEGVSPQRWMKHFGVKKEKSESKTEWKKRLRQLAESRMPDAPINRENADAFLIALYCKETQS